MADDLKENKENQVLQEYLPASSLGADSSRLSKAPVKELLENFANPTNTVGDSQQGLTQINTLLLCYGFPTISICSSAEPAVALNLVLDLVRLLLIQRQKDMTYRDDVSDTISRLKSENSLLMQKLKKAESSNARLDKELISTEQHIQNLEQDYQKQRAKLQSELRSLTTKYSQLQYQLQNLTHKKNRGEKELEAVKEKLLKLTHPSSSTSSASLANSSDSPGQQNAQKIEILNTSFNENDFKEHTKSLAYNTGVIKDISEVYESRIQEFLQEITKLQDTLSIFCSRLAALVEQYSTDLDPLLYASEGMNPHCSKLPQSLTSSAFLDTLEQHLAALDFIIRNRSAKS